jgi:hypothetical protein
LRFDLRAPQFVQRKARIDGKPLRARQAHGQLGEPVAAALMRALGAGATTGTSSEPARSAIRWWRSCWPRAAPR